MINNFKIVTIIAISVIVIFSCDKPNESKDIYASIPTLNELSGKWVSTDTIDMEPSIRNFQAQALVNRDLTSISWLAAAPYSGGYHTGVMRINGSTPICKEFKWEAHQALRRTKIDEVSIESATRMIPHENMVFWEVSFKNEGRTEKKLLIEQDHIGFISKYDNVEWQWWYPYPKRDGRTTVRDDETENIRKHIGQKIYAIETEVVELINGKPTKTTKLANWPSDEELLRDRKHSSILANDILVISDAETPAKTAFKNFASNSSIKNFKLSVHFSSKFN